MNKKQCKVTVYQADKEVYSFYEEEGTNLLELLQDHEIHLTASCGGHGTCGKCKIRVMDGEILPGEEDKKFFSKEMLEEGWRLACKDYLLEDVTLDVTESATEEFEVLSSGVSLKRETDTQAYTYGITADIGTTTIAMQRICLETGNVEETYTSVNRQRSYGADVLSRIQASVNGKAERLKKLIRDDLIKGIRKLTDQGRYFTVKMVIGANTTMVHLLMGYPCESLGSFPFSSDHLDTITGSAQKILGLTENEFKDMEVTVCPGASAFVGGDIISGLYSVDFHKREKYALFLDLGTNGEIAVGNKDRILTGSVAAGPAFEGGKIICGTGSIPGAVCAADYEDGKLALHTIMDKPVSGICGTGALELVNEFLKNGMLDESGLLSSSDFEEGIFLGMNTQFQPVRFYQEDVREIQLAKSAVCAGIEIMLKKAGITPDEIDTFYIAGGFGYKLNYNKAAKIGVFPEILTEKISAEGNSCLNGLKKCILDEGGLKKMQDIKNLCEEVQLSLEEDFSSLFMERMSFQVV